MEQTFVDAQKRVGQKISCQLEALSPVHVGSGLRLVRGLDYCTDKNKTFIAFQNKLLVYLKSNPEKINLLGEGGLIMQAGAKCRRFYSSATPNGKQYIHAFEMNGKEEFYLPGSSIKGAIRSIIINKLWKDNPNQTELLKSSNEIESKLIGQDANKDPLRILNIYDAEIRSQDINLYKVHILSLADKEGKSFKWWKPSANSENPAYATASFLEMLNKGAKLNFSLSFNTFLSENRIQSLSTKGIPTNFEALAQWANAYAKTVLGEEIKFFKSCNDKGHQYLDVSPVIESLEEIKNTIPADNSAFIMRMGWGSGYKNITGNLLTQEQLTTNFRERHKLAKDKTNFPFSKTRKIVFNGDSPETVCGWVKISNK